MVVLSIIYDQWYSDTNAIKGNPYLTFSKHLRPVLCKASQSARAMGRPQGLLSSRGFDVRIVNRGLL